MLILIEGNESSGKTTIVDELLKWRPWFIKCKRWEHKFQGDNHTVYPEPWQLNDAFYADWRFFLEAISYDPEGFNKATFVFDRSFITHIIFNRGLHPEYNSERMEEFYEAYEKKLLEIPHVVLYCKRNVDELFVDQYDDKVTLSKSDYDKLHHAYEYWRKRTKLNVIDVDNNKSLQDNILQILNIVGA